MTGNNYARFLSYEDTFSSTDYELVESEVFLNDNLTIDEVFSSSDDNVQPSSQAITNVGDDAGIVFEVWSEVVLADITIQLDNALAETKFFKFALQKGYNKIGIFDSVFQPNMALWAFQSAFAVQKFSFNIKLAGSAYLGS